MRSSHLTTLFSSPPPERSGSSAILGSFLAHSTIILLIYLGVKHMPHIYRSPQAVSPKYTVRLVQLRSSDAQIQWSPPSHIHQPGQHEIAKALSPGGSRALPSIPQLLIQKTPAPQTLIQPDLPPIHLQQKIQLSQVLMWTPEKVVVKQIVPPPPRENASANIEPSLSPPNHELIPSDVNMTPTTFTTELPAVSPGATSPIAIHGTGPELVPETTSTLLQQTTAASVVSISNVRMAEGNIVLPAVNETSLSSADGSDAPGSPTGMSKAGSGNVDSHQNGAGSGQDAGEKAIAANAAHGGSGQRGADTGSDTPQSTNADSGSGQAAGVKRISLPPNGQFGVVVVGSSIADEYPETNGLWSDRLAYTVYLRVGLARNWILQYSLPRSAEAAAAGAPIRPEAPWPYEIMRPTLDETDTDAVMVHGFVDAAGHFDHLTVVYPQAFQQSSLLLSSLREWKFRPAMQNGQSTEVEVLLIIPNQEQ